MTQFVFANGVQTTLAAAITATDTTLVVASTANLPTIAAGQQCPAVLGTTALFEIVYITNINSSTLTITRGQENTAAQAWGLGTQFEIAVTAGSIAAAQIIGTLGGVLTGTLPNPGMASGAASANIGTLGGVLTGTLPNPGMGSGVVNEGNIASGAIHRAQLSTATASSSTSVPGGGNSVFDLVGGQFSWWTIAAGVDNLTVAGYNGGNYSPGALNFYNLGTDEAYAYISENYILE